MRITITQNNIFPFILSSIDGLILSTSGIYILKYNMKKDTGFPFFIFIKNI